MSPKPTEFGSAATTGPDRSLRRDVLLGAGLVALVLFAGMIALLVWDAWFVNHDGTFYMALAHNLRRGAGYTFPDGSVATFRGPGYAGLLGAGWLLFDETARSAIWVSRAGGLLVPAALTMMLWRWTRSWWVALSVGVVAAVQPWALISGAQFFAPDGFGLGLTLVAMLVAFWSAGDLPDDRRLRVAGLVLGLAYVVKDPFVLAALVPVGVIALHREGGLRSAVSAAAVLGQGLVIVAGPWLLYSLIVGGQLPPGAGRLTGIAAWIVVAAVVAVPFLVPPLVQRGGPVLPVWGVELATFLLAMLAYVVVTAADVGRITELWNVLRADLQAQLYRGSGWGLLLPALALAVAWSILRRQQVTVQVATLLGLVGAAALVFATLTGSGMRNAVLFPYAVLLLVGLAVAGLATWRWWTVLPSLLLVGAAFLGSTQSSAATNDRLPIESLTAESPATVAAARWLQEEAAGSAVVGTPLFTQSMWRLTGGSDPWYLLPNHVMAAPRWEDGSRSFDQREAWAGIEPVSPTAETGISYTLNRSRTGAFLPGTITALVEGTDYFVLTGNARFSGSAFDAGGLLPTFEATDGLTPVWRSPVESHQWVIIYRVDDPFALAPTPPIIHLATDTAVPEVSADQTVLDGGELGALVRDILARPVLP